MLLMTRRPKASSTTPCHREPVARKYKPTGSQIRAAPIAGSSDSTAITAPHNSDALIPSTQKMTPPSTPCAAATRMLPFDGGADHGGEAGH
jgi:hypothetical protein